MKGVVYDCLVEMFDRKIIYLLAGVTFLVVIGIVMTRAIEFNVTVGPDASSPGAALASAISLRFLRGYLGVLVFLAVMGSAGLFPAMLEKGRVEYYLSKPLARGSLYLQKFIGIWLVYGGTILVLGGVTYAALATVHQAGSSGVLYLFLGSLVELFIWLAVTTCAGVLSGSTATAIMSAFLIWVAQTLLETHDLAKEFVNSSLVKTLIDVSYYILPKTSELSDLTFRLTQGQTIQSWLPLYSSVLFGFAAMYVAVWVFRRKDY